MAKNRKKKISRIVDIARGRSIQQIKDLADQTNELAAIINNDTERFFTVSGAVGGIEEGLAHIAFVSHSYVEGLRGNSNGDHPEEQYHTHDHLFLQHVVRMVSERLYGNKLRFMKVEAVNLPLIDQTTNRPATYEDGSPIVFQRDIHLGRLFDEFRDMLDFHRDIGEHHNQFEDLKNSNLYEQVDTVERHLGVHRIQPVSLMPLYQQDVLVAAELIVKYLHNRQRLDHLMEQGVKKKHLSQGETANITGNLQHVSDYTVRDIMYLTSLVKGIPATSMLKTHKLEGYEVIKQDRVKTAV